MRRLLSMRDSLKSRANWWHVGWFWAFVLLALPGCDTFLPLTPPNNVDPGPLNHIGAIFCDIEKSRACPSVDPGTGQALIPKGIPLSQAAVAFTVGDTSNIGLDYSPEAVARCGGVNPEVVTYEGAFPEGYPICVNCFFAVGGRYADAKAVCVAQCADFR